MLPPEEVDARVVREPSELREMRVAVEGSNEIEEELSKRPRPANAPAKPTLPIRSKSTRGRLANATLERSRRTVETERRHGNEELCLDWGAMRRGHTRPQLQKGYNRLRAV